MTQLHWAESQAIHVWRAAGHTPTQICAGMRLGRAVVDQELYAGVKTRRALEKLPEWLGIDLSTGRRVRRSLTDIEADAVRIWMALGYDASEVARVMSMTHDHVCEYAVSKKVKRGKAVELA